MSLEKQLENIINENLFEECSVVEEKIRQLFDSMEIPISEMKCSPTYIEIKTTTGQHFNVEIDTF